MNLDQLPPVRGTYRQNVTLAKTNWFGVGGPAEILFRPEDAQDLAAFIKNLDKSITYTTIGVGSNLLVRDSGIDGVVIKLGRHFAGMAVISHAEFSSASPETMKPDKAKLLSQGDMIIEAGAGALDANVANFAYDNNIAGLEFLIGIPGTIGGALAMNAGCYGAEIKDILLKAEAIDGDGNLVELCNQDFNFSYRSNSLPKNLIFTKAWLRGTKADQSQIKERMDFITKTRTDAQPLRTKTGGSTFANPPGHKAWELIDGAGCRGLKVGDAIMSEKHCNFMINLGQASAKDLEILGETVKNRVKEKFGIELKWEIKIIGKEK